MTIAARPRARKGEGDRLREEILDAAGRLLARAGDQNAVSIRAVADAVGVSPPAIYLHFADKTDLIFAVCEAEFARLDAEMEAAAADATDPIDDLRRRGRAYVEFGLRNPEPYRVVFMSRPGIAPDRLADRALPDAHAFTHLVQAVQRAIDAGVLAETDATMVAIRLWVVVHGLTSLLLSKPGFPWPPVEDLLTHVVDAAIT